MLVDSQSSNYRTRGGDAEAATHPENGRDRTDVLVQARNLHLSSSLTYALGVEVVAGLQPSTQFLDDVTECSAATSLVPVSDEFRSVVDQR